MEYHSGGSLPLLGRPRYCPGANANGGYLCETGHCCGETGCCTYYYELWWFWLLWTVLILFSCCCAYRHRRAKLRVQQQQRQREISLLAYHGANSYPSSMLDLSFLASLKLPSYEEVAAQPSTPPPPYSSVFTTPRYPQPPRAADPHLLTQHGPLLHRPLSDGPSSLSSDNSSSCSCDSCCPSSPCSSSLSAPVTYETDTSHATTPSEAAPLTLDVTMETIAAAASRLEVNGARFVSERMLATVAIEIGDEDAAKPQEPIAMDSLVPRAVSPHPLLSPGSEVVLSVVTTSPAKQQLDLASCTPTVSSCSPSTLPSPSLVDTTLPSIQVIRIEGPADSPETTPATKITSMSGPSTPTASNSDGPTVTKTLDLTRTFDTANVPSSPTSMSSPDVGRTLALTTGSDDLTTLYPNPSLVPIPAPSNHTQVLVIVPSNHTQASTPEPSNHTQASTPEPSNHTKASTPEPSNHTQASTPASSNHTQASTPEPSNHTQASTPASSNHTQASIQVATNLTQPPDAVPTNLNQDPDNIPSNLTLVPDPVTTSLTQGESAISTNVTQDPEIIPTKRTQTPNLVPSNFTLVPSPQSTATMAPDCLPDPVLTLKPAHPIPTLATDAAPTSPTVLHCHIPELSPGSGLGPTSPRSGLPRHLGDTALPADSGPSLVVSQSSELNLTSPLPSNVHAGFISGSGSGSCSNVGSISAPLSTPPVLAFSTPTTSSSSSFCPAITIESESSFTLSQSPSALSPASISSPPSILSPPVLSSISLPAPALLLDPLTALHQSNKGGSSSGHASSLSPSPRATQSPPKQTLFSPCVDIFEPVPPSWEDGEDEQEEEDNDDDEDEDMGADESQYRHRRLTGDSGIEVCRCRVEDEEEEQEEEEEGDRVEDKKGGVNTGLHDSMDCPARGQITTGEALTLCNPTSTTTPTSEDSGKVIIVMETV